MMQGSSSVFEFSKILAVTELVRKQKELYYPHLKAVWVSLTLPTPFFLSLVFHLSLFYTVSISSISFFFLSQWSVDADVLQTQWRGRNPPVLLADVFL